MDEKKDETVPKELATTQQELDLKSTEQEEKAVAVVIFHSKEAAKGNELFYLIQSIRKFLQVPKMQIIVVGDKEDWFDDSILHVQSNNLYDVEKLTDCNEFIIMSPNTFFLRPCLLAHLEIPKCFADGEDKLPVFLHRDNPQSPLNHHDVMPIPADWDTTPWFVPVVSSNPDYAIFKQYTDSRFFMVVDQDAWGEFIENYLKALLDVEAPAIKEGI